MPEQPEFAQPIHFAGAVLDRHRHVCAFFNSADEEQQVMAPFVREGIERGEKAFHIVDPALREDYLRWLEGFGIPIGALLETEQFDLRTWDEAYLRDGHFDQDR